MSLLLARYILPALAAIALGFGAGWQVSSWRAQSALEALRAADANARAQGEQAVRRALQGQLAQAQATSENNAQVIRDLQARNVAVVADRAHTDELVRRLLQREAQRAAAGPAVHQAADQPGVAAPGPASGDASLASLLGNAHDECERNADQLDSLIAEVKAQL